MTEVVAAASPWRKGLAVSAAAGLAVLIWSGTLVVTKLAVVAVDGIAIGMLRTIVGAIAVVPLLWLSAPVWPRGRTQLCELAVSTLGGFVLFPLLFSVGLRYTAAAHGALIMAALPALTGLFVHVLERRIPGPRWWLGMTLALVGEALLIGSANGLNGGSLVGDLLVLGGCAAAACGYIAGGRLGRRIGSFATTCFSCLAGGLLLLPAVPFRLPQSGLFTAGIAGWGAVLYLALFATLLAYMAWYWALGRGGIARVAALQFLQAPIAVVLAVLLLGEPLPPALLVASVCILAGVALVQRG